jgi:hypothetical protein
MRADDPHVDQGRIIHDSQLTTHNSGLVWFIGSSHGRSPELVDNYKEPTSLGDVVWKAAGSESLRDQEQRWPIFHPSEADPEGGYRFHPYTIEFRLDDEPVGAYLFCIQYLVIAPRLARLEIELNGAIGCAYLRPTPSRSHEIGLLAGLHTSIYAEGICEVVIPASLLRRGANRMTLVAQDDGEVVRVEGIERIRRLDRMANGAGFIYQHLTFSQIPCGSDLRPEEVGLVARVEVKPSVVYRLDETGTLWERCHLYLELNRGTAGQERDLTLLREADGQKFCHRLDVPEVAFGHLHFPFDLADGAGPVRYTLCGRIGGEEIHAEGEFEHCRKWKVFVAPHVHADIGYTHRQWEVAERLCRNIDRALDMLEPSLTPQPPMSDTEVRATEDEGRGGLMLSPPLPMGGYWTRQGVRGSRE